MRRSDPKAYFQLEVRKKIPRAMERAITMAVNADNCLGVRFCVLSI